MDPTASILNINLSIEKFLWDKVASIAGVLLFQQGDLATRQEELLDADRAVVWHTTGGAAGNHGELTLFVGATTIRDPGGIRRIVLLDKIKEAFDINAGIDVWQYENTGLITDPAVRVNELAIIGPLHWWPEFTDPNIRYTTKHVSQKLKFAQRRV
jgi:hypothetical protein